MLFMFKVVPSLWCQKRYSKRGKNEIKPLGLNIY